jgi:hypothetical protein
VVKVRLVQLAERLSDSGLDKGTDLREPRHHLDPERLAVVGVAPIGDPRLM